MSITITIIKRLTLLSFLLIILSYASAQESGSINIEEIKQWSNELAGEDGITAIKNAVSNNDITKLALNRDNLGAGDEYFTYRVETKGITNQKKSGRCWLFTGLNVFRPVVIEKFGMKKFGFSHNYLFFYDQLEKANLFLEGIIETRDLAIDDRKVEWLLKNPIGDGGQWTGVADLVNKYGIVPSDIMPESTHSENTRIMSGLLRRFLREQGLELRELAGDGNNIGALREAKDNMLADVYRILVITLGEPPSSFVWRYEDKDGKISEEKEYTPKSFYREFVNIPLEAYIMLMNDPTREFHKVYEIEFDRHMYEGRNWKYINLPAGEIKKFAIASLKDKQAMYFSCDVGKQLNKTTGTLDINNFDYDALFGVNFGMDKKDRIKTFDSVSSHGMALAGVDLGLDGKPRKWLLENSWGKTGFNGYLIMTDKWFDEYMFRLVVDKTFIDPEILKILDEEPILLPPWDPMFMFDE